MKKITRLLEDCNNNLIAIYDDGDTMRASDKILTDLLNDEPAALALIASNSVIYDARGISDERERKAKKQKEEDDNRETCKRIAEELEAYASGDCVKCPHCGETHYKYDFDESENEDGETVYTCPDCGEEVDDFDDLDMLSLYDYLSDNYGIEYRIGNSGELRSAEIMIACGGPNIYIDTDRRAVVLYWWGSSAEYPINCAADVDEYAAELWEACSQ